jgi:hypothetical protein
VDGDKQDKAPERSALRAWTAGDPIYFTEWPRETLHRFMRGVIATVFLRGAHLDGSRAMATAGPPSADEALDGLRRLFLERYKTHRFLERDYVYAVESLAGTDATLDVIARAVEAFEATSPPPPGMNYLCRTAIAQTVPSSCCARLPRLPRPRANASREPSGRLAQHRSAIGSVTTRRSTARYAALTASNARCARTTCSTTGSIGAAPRARR